MEKLLVKTGIYSFIISFIGFLIFFPREHRYEEGPNDYVTEIVSYSDFFFNITRYSAIVMVIAIFILAVSLWSSHSSSTNGNS
ncbi:hypothetical protein ACSVDE_16765 [Pseudalkalibacillus sp. Hm43]|uniref:hypothetical protein n=1 Tax=Pseudalkalibacillus sp. Hm43 TaxID=3450742 RepID=UPI003F432B51